MNPSLSEAIEHIYDERKDFVIIGLTGRTGSGCTTVSKLLSSTLEEFCPPKPKYGCLDSNEERKYRVIYDYLSQNWHPFIRIEMRSIITSFILEYNFNAFIEYLKSQHSEIPNLGDLINSLETSIKSQFNEMHELRKSIKEKTEENEEYLREDAAYNFYFKELCEFTEKLKGALIKFHSDTYTEIYQALGNNLRGSGEPYSNSFMPENLFKLSQRTNTLIKVLRKRNKTGQKKGRVLVVIDALRNPYEATFFKDRYAAFYLVAVNTDDKYRVERLGRIGLNHIQIEQLDDKEYPDKKDSKDSKEIFAYQNIQKCLEISDIFLYNPETTTNDFSNLKRDIFKYVSLIIHPGLVTPTHIERTMQLAFNAKMNSGCISRQVGAAVTDNDFSIKAIGWNSTPECQVDCNLKNLNDLQHFENKSSYSDFELTNSKFRDILNRRCKEIEKADLKGRNYSYCFKDLYNEIKSTKTQVYTRSLHAEENAFLQIAKYGGAGVKDGYLFTTASPCELCSKKAYQLGIKKIYYIDPYPGISLDHILNNGTRRPELILFTGAIGRAFTQLYNPIISYKDELSLLLDR